MPASIRDHGQSTLPDGRVIVSINGSTYVYMPSQNEWITMATVPASFNQHGQSLLMDGRAMIIGGSSSGALNTTYMYDIDNNKWVSAALMATGVYAHGQSVLNDGNILISGGRDGRNTVYAYTPSSNTWASMAPLPEGRYTPGQSVLFDGRVLYSGGASGSGFARNGVYMYTADSGIGSWATVATLPITNHGHGQSTLFDDRVLISGGLMGNSAFNTTTYLYTSNSDIGSWSSAATLATGFRNHGQSMLADGRVLISGGTGTGYDGKSAYIYTPAG